jgi:hypothetical protein
LAYVYREKSNQNQPLDHEPRENPAGNKIAEKALGREPAGAFSNWPRNATNLLKAIVSPSPSAASLQYELVNFMN